MFYCHRQSKTCLLTNRLPYNKGIKLIDHKIFSAVLRDTYRPSLTTIEANALTIQGSRTLYLSKMTIFSLSNRTSRKNTSWMQATNPCRWTGKTLPCLHERKAEDFRQGKGFIQSCRASPRNWFSGKLPLFPPGPCPLCRKTLHFLQILPRRGLPPIRDPVPFPE